MVMIDSATLEERLFQKAVEIFRKCWDREELARGMADYVSLVEELAGNREVACRAGCPHCCVLTVTVLLPEAAAIALHLVGTLTFEELSGLAARLDRQRRLVRWMEDGERFRRQHRCPFLDEHDRCVIHPVRPLVCRAITSLDSRLCQEALDPMTLEAPGAVPMDMVRKTVMEDAFRALVRVQAACGWGTRGIELSAGVAAFLARPELIDLMLDGGRLPPELWE
jgi:Fe-S-cluster containining protein